MNFTSGKTTLREWFTTKKIHSARLLMSDPLDSPTPSPLITDDGSYTLYHPDYAQSYHSTRGAITESEWVFLAHASLAERLKDGPVSLLEIGVGTGLNLALSASLATRMNATLHYTGVEQCPPARDALQALAYHDHPAIDRAVWQRCLDAFDRRSAQFSLSTVVDATILWQRFETIAFPSARYDVLFHDGFSADVNPELWTEEALQTMVEALVPGGVLVTYSVQGHLRRTLARCGMEVERLPGPPGGKRQVLRAVKPR